MTECGQFTSAEIFSQPEAWADTLTCLEAACTELGDFLNATKYTEVIFTGCGSPFFLARAMLPYLQAKVGIRAQAVPASEVFLFPRETLVPGGRPLLVPISRSGETSEVIKAIVAFRERFGNHVLGISPYADRPMNFLCTFNLTAPAGQEKSIAQTRAYTCMQLLVQGFIEIMAGGNLEPFSGLVDAGANLLRQYKTSVANFGKNLDFERIYFLGSAPRYGLACEAMLKMKEMTLTHAEAYHFMEFRHGPKAMVNEHTLIVGLLSQAARKEETNVLQDMRKLGAKIITVGNHLEGVLGDLHIDFMSSLAEGYDLPLYLPMLQWMAFSRAVAKGLDPDNPTNLDAVVFL